MELPEHGGEVRHGDPGLEPRGPHGEPAQHRGRHRAPQQGAAGGLHCRQLCISVQLYAVGGRDGSACLRSVESYDPHTNKWSAVASMCKVIFDQFFHRLSMFLHSYFNVASRRGGGRGGERLPVRRGRARRPGSLKPAAVQVYISEEYKYSLSLRIICRYAANAR